jgi:hypothetical protein
MARIRTIKPEFFTSLTIASLPIEARLTFIGLWTHVDDEGRCVDDTRLIRAALWPLDDRSFGDVEKDLAVLADASLIRRYQAAGKRYLAVCGWQEHQRINRATKSKLPPPPDRPNPPPTSANTGFTEDSVSTHGDLTEDSLGERKGKEQGTGKGRGSPAPPDADAPAEAEPPAEEPRADVEQVCAHLADKIAANGSKKPATTEKWRTEARRLIDADMRPVAEIMRVIDWCQADKFWRSNILSMPKLREKYDQLRLASQRGNDSRASPAAWTNYDDQSR